MCGFLLLSRHVSWSVCLSVCVFNTSVSPASTDPGAVWRADSCGPKVPCIRWGVHIGAAWRIRSGGDAASCPPVALSLACRVWTGSRCTAAATCCVWTSPSWVSWVFATTTTRRVTSPTPCCRPVTPSSRPPCPPLRRLTTRNELLPHTQVPAVSWYVTLFWLLVLCLCHRTPSYRRCRDMWLCVDFYCSLGLCLQYFDVVDWTSERASGL